MRREELYHYGVKGMKWKKYHSRKRNDSGKSASADRRDDTPISGGGYSGEIDVELANGSHLSNTFHATAKSKKKNRGFHSRKRNDSGKSASANLRRKGPSYSFRITGKKRLGQSIFTR